MNGGRRQAALDGYAGFLLEKDLPLPKHRACVVRWVREFLLFAQDHSGQTFEQTLDSILPGWLLAIVRSEPLKCRPVFKRCQPREPCSHAGRPFISTVSKAESR